MNCTLKCTLAISTNSSLYCFTPQRSVQSLHVSLNFSALNICIVSTAIIFLGDFAKREISLFEYFG